jgi:glycosyltransferase involved in cell wall biosynthesis
MKILFYNHTNQVSGAEQVLLLLLARLSRDRFETVLLSPAEGKLQSSARAIGVNCETVDPLQARFTWNPRILIGYLASFVSIVLQVRARVRKSSPELIHANSIRAGLVISTATIGLRVPIVWHIHDLLPKHPLSTLIRFFVLLRPPARIGAVSHASAVSLRGNLLRRYPARVAVSVIHNGIQNSADTVEFPNSRFDALRKEVRVRAGDPLIGIVGNLTPGKGQLELINAFQSVLKRIPNAALLIIGSDMFNRADGYRERLLITARTLGILDRVKFLGQRDDVPAIMRSLDLLVLNSTTEACPLVVLEGLAAGVPVLSTIVGGVPEIITHRENGWLIPAGDEPKLANAIVSLVQNPKLRATLAENGRSHVANNFTVDKFMTQWESLYAQPRAAVAQTVRAPVTQTVSLRQLSLRDRPQTNSLRYSNSLTPWAHAAVFHDNFAQMGGAEKVAEEIYGLLPGATLHSTVAVPEILSDGLREAQIRTSWMQRLPGLKRHFRHYFLFYPFAVESVDLSKYDLIVSSCFGYAKGVRKRRGAVHVSYCHTPMRWVWRYQDYSARAGFGGLTRRFLPLLLSILKRWDLRASRRPDYFIANSNVVAERIRKFYGRDSVVIPPPIDVKRFTPASPEPVEDYYLVLSRLVPYKRIDLAMEACTRLNRKLFVIGDGPDRARLEKQAGPNVRFLGRQPDDAVVGYAARCRALLFPGEEDFGMTPLEVNAAGRPVIAFRAGGAVETVVENVTGLFFDEPTSASLADAIERFERQSWDSLALQTHARKFDRAVFAERLLAFLREVTPAADLAEQAVWESFPQLEAAAPSFSGLRPAGN